MLTSQDIRKLTDFILLNAYSVSSTGLYNGKVGMSLCLFEVARSTNNESLEEHAFELLQESLLSKNEDVGFENGLAGIGYVLQYLIENKFIDADFDEMFGEQTAKILQELEKRKTDPIQFLNSIKTIYFLSEINKTRKNITIAGYIKMIFEAVELYLSVQFADFNQFGHQNNKMTVLSVFEDYLRLVDYSGYKDFPSSLLATYADLYRQGRIASDFAICYFLETIILENTIADYADVISNNKKYSLMNMRMELMTLRERTDVFQLLKMSKDTAQNTMGDFETKLFGKYGQELEKEIVQSIPRNAYMAGYGAGVARLLMMTINPYSPLK